VDDLERLISILNDEEAISRLKSLIDSDTTAKKRENCKKEKSEIEKLKKLLEERDKEILRLKEQLEENSKNDNSTLLNEIFRLLPDYCFLIDERGNIVQVNDLVLSLTDFESIDEILGENFFAVCRYHLESKDAEKRFKNAIKKRESLRDLVAKFVSLNGREFRGRISLHPLKLNGSFSGFFIHLRDVTESEESIGELSSLLRATYEQIPSPVAAFFVDRNGVIQYANDVVAQLSGHFSADEIIGKHVGELFQTSGEKTIAEKVLSTGEAVLNLEAVTRTRDGKEIPVLISCSPIYLNGELVGAIDIFVDISELREKERKANEALKLVEAIFRSIPHPAYMLFVGKDGKIKYATEEVARFMDFENASELVGKRMHEILQTSNKKTIVDKVIETGEPVLDLQVSTRTKNGKEIPVLLSCVPVHLDGELIGAIDVFVDITEVKKKEEEARKAFEFVENVFRKIPYPVYFMFVDKDYRIQYANEEIAKFHGLKSLDEVIGQYVYDLFHIESGKTVAQRVIDSGEPIFNHETISITKDGKEIPVVLSCVPIYDGNGEMLGVIDVFTDLTKLKEKEAKMEEIIEYCETALDIISNGIKELQAGNLDIRLKKPEKDIEDVEVDEKFVETMEAFNEFIERLSSIITNVSMGMRETNEKVAETTDALNQMNSGMEQISSASQQIATGSENLSRLANESMLEIRESEKRIKKLVEDARESSKLANESSQNAEKTGALGNEALEKMNIIASEIEKASKLVETLEEAVQKIGKVTEKIKTIADQTNLLALNAAIEAARAGEYGRGFAVVADEIRKLAEESRRSTEEINEIVKMVQEETQKVINATKSVKDISLESSVRIREALNKAMEISESVKRITEMFESVTKSAESVYEKIEHVAKNFEEIASTAEENAASSEETSAAIEEQTAAIQQINIAMVKIKEIASQTLETLVENFRTQAMGDFNHIMAKNN